MWLSGSFKLVSLCIMLLAFNDNRGLVESEVTIGVTSATEERIPKSPIYCSTSIRYVYSDLKCFVSGDLSPADHDFNGRGTVLCTFEDYTTEITVIMMMMMMMYCSIISNGV